MKCGVETINPSKARKYLEKNINNRPLKERYILELAMQMEAGQWQLNGESIKFDTDGNLKDGQNRLNAVVLANVPVQMLVVRDVPVDCFDTIDRGRLRSAADVLFIHGEKNCTTLGGALTWLWKHGRDAMRATGGGPNAKPTIQDQRATLEIHPGIRESIAAINGIRRIMSPSMAAFCHYLCNKHDPKVTEKFFKELTEGEGLLKTQGSYRLRERLYENKALKSKLRPLYLGALAVKAFNYDLYGMKCTCLKWYESEEFPRPGDKPSASKGKAA